ncbi:hypothetical protein LCGC14_1888230 [marine sediment metagenome]|uniref:Uncharacterized protein n=1 Tax=marine sediment metagenome TaxID=412755 RepID=A0A0F9G056_9ZZZZ
MPILQFFGPKEQKREPRLIHFGVIVPNSRAFEYGVCYHRRKTLHTLVTNTPSDLWEVITNYDTPSTWYVYDINILLYHLILEILPPDELTKKIIKQLPASKQGAYASWHRRELEEVATRLETVVLNLHTSPKAS